MKKDKEDDNYIYMVTDDTIDIGKEPLPKTENDIEISNKLKREFGLLK